MSEEKLSKYIESKQISIVIPCFNEKENLIHLIPTLRRLYPESSIIIVDDNSPDGTASYVAGLSKTDERVLVVNREGKMGRGSATLDGFKKAIRQEEVKYVLEMDADFSHNPSEIKKLLSCVESKTVVIGSRYMDGSQIINWPLRRKIMSRLANFYARLILRIPINDYTNGFRIYPKKSIEGLISSDIKEKGYASLSESAYLLFKKGYTFREVPTTFNDRKVGKSNTTISEYFRSLWAIIRIKYSY